MYWSENCVYEALAQLMKHDKKPVDEIQQQMDAINLSSLPNLTARFDPTVWERDNPLGIPEVYSLNKEQLEVWAILATEVRKKILKKAELYDTYGGKIKKEDKKKDSK